MHNYSDNCKKEHASYPEQNILYYKNVANITIDSDSTTPQKKQNERGGYIQEDHQIPFDENEENNSIIVNKTIETNAKETIKPNTRNGI